MNHHMKNGLPGFWRRFVFGCSFTLLASFFPAPVVHSADGATEYPALPSNVTELVFATRQMNYDGHWYANFGYYADSTERKAFRSQGRLCRLNLATGKTTDLVCDPDGAVRDPQVHYDGHTILFSYRKGGTDAYHLYEIQADGTGLKQLTEGPYDDFEPSYLPDGDILFVSSRCRRWVNCWLTQVAVLHRCDRTGANIRQISANIEQDNTPWPLPDGRILYTRWEYVDRSQVDYHHLWTANPDGTGQMVYYGNLHPGTVMIDAKPIPGSDTIMAVFSAGHGQREHAGALTIVSPQKGPDNIPSARRITKTDDFRDPYPLGQGQFLAAQNTRIVLVNEQGDVRELYRLPKDLESKEIWCHEPRPLVSRPLEKVLQPRVNYAKSTGTLLLSNVRMGRNMAGVKPGEIKKILVMESLPKPINYTGGMEPLSYGGTFTLERILGTVPVESDGSAYFDVPALRSLFLIALDEHENSVKRMQSFLSVMPGETMGCVGCHENRAQAPAISKNEIPLAARRAASVITPVSGIPDVFDFPRDIQPILDRYCIRCHDYDHRDGRVILTGDHGPMYSHSYYTLTCRHQIVDGRNDPKSNLAPRSIGATASPLMAKFSGSHHEVKASRDDIEKVRYWIESGAPYPGTYAALGCGMIGGYHENQEINMDADWPESKAAAEVIDRRCASCHVKSWTLPRTLSDERDVSFWRPDFNDPRLNLSRHMVYNLSRPEKSLILLAPLQTSAGGYGACRDQNKQPVIVFKDRNDPDYQKLLAICNAGQRQLVKIQRFDMPNFKPTAAYVREMKRFGVIARDSNVTTNSLNVYELDRAYWDLVGGFKPVAYKQVAE
jgi:hypothetical protein